MTTAHACILIACLLPIACSWTAKSKGFQRSDNHNPRQWLATTTGWQARAHAAQLNGYEALPLFIAGVLVAERTQASPAWVSGLALAFVAARIGFIVAYIADWANLRSTLWLIGLACSIALFFIG